MSKLKLDFSKITYLSKTGLVFECESWPQQVLFNSLIVLLIGQVENIFLFLATDEATLFKVIPAVRVLEALLAVEASAVDHISSLGLYKKINFG